MASELSFTKIQIDTPLIAIADARDRLRVTDPAFDAEITRAVVEAQNIILDYLKKGADPEWTEATLPKPVRAAVLLMLTHQWEHRGDDMSPSASGDTPDKDAWEAVDRILVRWRDPAIA